MREVINILIIEDNKNIALTEKICLETANYQVLIAADGITGLEKALEVQPDLILLDILIPKLNGYLVLEALQNDPSLCRIPVLVTSAKAQVADLKQAFTYKIAGYLVKPFLPTELLAKINAILKQERNDV
jgi:DNA-binding response OmpR family regulator